MELALVEQTDRKALPAPRVEFAIREATDADLGAIDALQKAHHKQLGFLNKPTLEGKVKLRQVLVAEVEGDEKREMRDEKGNGASAFSSLGSHFSRPTLVGYLIGQDRYKHRDELGVIFQLCVAKEFRRSLVAAHLLKAQFERSAYGCKLYCCWCAQDLEANRFYEAMGFVPIAYRAGSLKKGPVKKREMRDEKGEIESSFSSVGSHFSSSRARVHIFWQKRIRAGDTTTPWWFPSETRGGLMDASRIALPIPLGTHWSEAKPLILPAEAELSVASGQLPDGELSVVRGRTSTSSVESLPVKASRRKSLLTTGNSKLTTPVPKPVRTLGGLRFAPVKPPVVEQVVEQPKRAPKPKVKSDPRLMRAARELRDRWMEEVQRGNITIEPAGKYEPGRHLDCIPTPRPQMLEAA